MESCAWLIFLRGATGSDDISDYLGGYVLVMKMLDNMIKRVVEEHTTGTHCTDTDPREVVICLIVLDVATNDGTHSCLFHIPCSVVGPPI